ncbi:MAG: hypothetical protein Q8861_01900 [Bacteroidota bacterium]|nr:hypothetical protein [Bacteroidota bacterium]
MKKQLFFLFAAISLLILAQTPQKSPTLFTSGAVGKYFQVTGSNGDSVQLGNGQRKAIASIKIDTTSLDNRIKTKLAIADTSHRWLPNSTKYVRTVNMTSGDILIDKSTVGLSNVDNTSDATKPISTATQTALNGKENLISTGTIYQYIRGDKSLATMPTSLPASDVYAWAKSATKPTYTPLEIGAIDNIVFSTIGGGLVTSSFKSTNTYTLTTNVASGFLIPTDSQAASWTGKMDSSRVKSYVAGKGYLTGITGSQVTTALGYTPENSANKNAANGYAGLDAGGKVPVNLLPSAVMQYIGVWDAQTNTPTLSNSVGQVGQVYEISMLVDSVIANRFGRNDVFYNRDFVAKGTNGWEVVPSGTNVRSVNGKQGIVTLSTTDITEGINKYYTDAHARSALSVAGSVLSYNSNTGVLSIPAATSGISGYMSTADQSFAGVKTFTNGLIASGVQSSSGGIFYGQAGTFPTGLGTYVANYVSPTYGARVLAYDGANYQDLKLGKLISGSNFQLHLNADGTSIFNTSLKASSFATPTGTASQFLKANGSIDGNTYLTGNQTVTLSGDVTGSGATAITTTLANSGVTAGTYKSVTVDAKGRVTSGTNPTTLSAYGITDAIQNQNSSSQTANLWINGTAKIAGGIAHSSNTDQPSIGSLALGGYIILPGTNKGGGDDGSVLLTSRYDSGVGGGQANIKFRTYDGTTVTTLGTMAKTGSFTWNGQIISTLATGTAPFSIASTTLNANLNADLLDGQHGSFYTTAGNLSGTIPSSVLANSSAYIGTTAIALNRSSASQTLTGVSIDGTAAKATSLTISTGAAVNKVLTSDASGNANWGKVVDSGTYTPTYSTLLGCSNVTTTSAIYTRTGNVYDIDISGTLTEINGYASCTFYVTLPGGETANAVSGVGSLGGSGYQTAGSVVKGTNNQPQPILDITYETGTVNFNIHFKAVIP